MEQVAGDFLATERAVTAPLSRTFANLLALLVGLAPALLVPLTWTTDAAAADATWFLRATSTTVLLSEMAVVAVALLRGIAWRRFTDSALLLPAAALAAIAVGTALYAAPSPAAAHIANLQYLLHVAFFIALVSLLRAGLEAEALRVAYAAGFLLFAVGVGLFFLLTPWTIPFDWRHHVPGVAHVRQYGLYAVPVAALSLGGLVAVGDLPRRLLFGIAIFAASFLCAYTGSRGALYSMLIGSALGLALLPALRARRVLIPAALAIAGGILLALPLPAPSDDMGAARSVPGAEAAQSEDFTTGRTALWVKTWGAIEQRPLFGYGEGQLPWVVDFYRMPQPHNVILQIAFAWGLVGLALAAWVAVRIGWRTFGRVRADPQANAGTLLIVAMLGVYAMVDGVFYRSIPLSIFAAAFAMTWAVPTRYRP